MQNVSARGRVFGICFPLILIVSACALQRPPAGAASPVPAQWQAPLPVAAGDAMPVKEAAPLPHGGDPAMLAQWWRQQGDTLLAGLIDAAQEASPTLASAKSRIEQARATRVASGGALGPTLNGTGSISRSSQQPPLPMGTFSQGALQAAWEIDMFGANQAARDAAQARLEGAQAGWHDARVSVAAETANLYYSAIACEKTHAINQSDAASRAETSRLTDLSAQAGFAAPATSALARASAAEAAARATQQRAQCDLDIKGLVALTALPEAELRQQFADALRQAAPLATFDIASVPAQVLTQRPDVYAAEREVAAASADVGGARAQRYPRLTLNGSIGAADFRTSGANINLQTWSIGPLSLSLPLYDGGRRAANVEAAQARYEEAASNYRASARRAVREVEEALVSLRSTAERAGNVRTAVDGYRASFESTRARYESGLASLVELEDARRTRLVAELTLVTLERERRAAWVALYRATGGGWRRPESSLASGAPASPDLPGAAGPQ